MPPSVLRISTSERPSSAGDQPMPTSCDQPKTSPLDRSSRSLGLSGSRPAGPGWDAVTWKSASSPESRTLSSDGPSAFIGKLDDRHWVAELADLRAADRHHVSLF